jgi:hypothetical protein
MAFADSDKISLAQCSKRAKKVGRQFAASLTIKQLNQKNRAIIAILM